MFRGDRKAERLVGNCIFEDRITGIRGGEGKVAKGEGRKVMWQ